MKTLAEIRITQHFLKIIIIIIISFISPVFLTIA